MSLSDEQIQYPRNIFQELIHGDSPYALYLFQWVPYHGENKKRRLKMFHDVKTFDGRTAEGVWPNGDHCGPFKDDDVEFIRISRKQHEHEWSPKMKRNEFADELPEKNQ